jgi:hypothetical protein
VNAVIGYTGRFRIKPRGCVHLWTNSGCAQEKRKTPASANAGDFSDGVGGIAIFQVWRTTTPPQWRSYFSLIVRLISVPQLSQT